jgi:hypothetical protein
MIDTPELQSLLNRIAIKDVLMRYFNAADHGDKDGVRSCFTDDVWAQYEGREAVRGIDALLNQITLFDNLDSGACKISTHFAGNLVFKGLSSDSAETENNAFAFLVNASGATVAVRSLRYLDRLRREQGQWKICARIHTLDWSGELPCSFSRIFTEKITQLPLPGSVA